ncbi:MAG: MFS transporter [Pseudomonadota bacterium]
MQIFVALSTTTSIQALVTMASLAVAVFGPQAARDIGVAPESIGIYASLTYVGAMLGSLLAGGFILRYGPIRFSQYAMLLCAIGLLICVGGQWWWFVISALVFGLGYGPTTPASSHILSRHTPSANWSLLFSIKQTGVPLGGVLAGLLIPYLLLFFDWKEVAVIVAALITTGILLLQLVRRRYDSELVPDQPLVAGNIVAPLRLVFTNAKLRFLAVSSFFFSSTQQSYVYYLVTYLEVGLSWSTQAAGLALSVLGISATVGRVGWGAIADARGNSRQVLAILALGMGGAAMVTANFHDGWAPALVLFVCAIFGATGAAWNGIYIAEITRSVEPDQVGHATGGGLFVTFAGVMITPPLFGLLAEISGGFKFPFLVIGIAPLLIGMVLIFRR